MIFEEQIARKPDHYPWAQQFIEVMQDGHWTDRRFKFTSDVQDFRTKFNDKERQILVRSLATIGQLEVPVKKFWSRLGDNLPHPSLIDLGFVMAAIEVIHGKAYERLLTTLGIHDIFEEILKLDIIKGRDTYLKKHIRKFHSDNKKQFLYSLILFTLFVENIALFAQFYTILWLAKAKNAIQDTSTQVEYTSREENIHALVGMRTTNQIRTEHPELFDEELKGKVTHEGGQSVKYEFEIIDWLIGDFDETTWDGATLNARTLKELIKDRMNKSLIEIGFEPIFEVDEEILKGTEWFNEQLLGNNQKDFFHGKPVEYAHDGFVDDGGDLF